MKEGKLKARIGVMKRQTGTIDYLIRSISKEFDHIGNGDEFICSGQCRLLLVRQGLAKSNDIIDQAHLELILRLIKEA